MTVVQTNVQLEYPVEHKGQTYTELQLRRTRVGDMESMDIRPGVETTKNIQFMADLCEVPPDLIRCLDMVDYMRLTEVVADFLPKLPLPAIGMQY